jgi:signal transduction histidine kinase/ActR/RegA family two-component response regulator
VAARLEFAAQAAGLGIWEWDISSGAMIWDARMRQIYGLAPGAEVSYGRWQAQLLPECTATVDAAMRSLLDNPGSREVEFQILRADGEKRFIRSVATLIKGAHGNLRLIGVDRDDTQALLAAEDARKNAEAQERANAVLMQSATMREEFLAAMSHELRTPLNAVLGLAEMLLEGIHGDLTPPQAHSVQTIEESGRHLLELISDILEASTIESSAVELRPSWVDVDLLVDTVKRRYAAAAVRKGLRLAFEVAHGLKPLWADERRLQQMLSNLVSNAIKFTPEGGEVQVHLQPDAHHTALTISVQDTGIGIADADIRRLFEPFVQLETGLGRRYGGTGLGLSLVRTLARLHGGEVTVSSTPGRGSTFLLTLPLSEAHTADSGAPQTRAGNSRVGPSSRLAPAPLVLVAEDNETNFELLDAYLTSQGYRVAHAVDGVEAVAKGRSLRPDLVLMDIQMPGMDGLQATRLLRAEADLKVARVPIVAVTAMALPGDRERCMEAGVDGYLAKPVSLHALTATIARLIAGPAGATPQ